MNLYCLMDMVAQECAPPFEAKNDNVALRNWQRHVSQNPEIPVKDYCLLFIGEYDKEDGMITSAIPRVVEPNINDDVVAGDEEVLNG